MNDGSRRQDGDAKNRKEEARIIDRACELLERRLSCAEATLLNNHKEAARYCWLKLVRRQREVFAVMALSAKGRLLGYHELFQGTIDHTPMYPREIARYALIKNAACLIVAHNHPSGDPTPSERDVESTRQLQQILQLVGVVLIDHIVVGAKECVSMAQAGLLKNHQQEEQKP